LPGHCRADVNPGIFCGGPEGTLYIQSIRPPQNALNCSANGAAVPTPPAFSSLNQSCTAYDQDPNAGLYDLPICSFASTNLETGGDYCTTAYIDDHPGRTFREFLDPAQQLLIATQSSIILNVENIVGNVILYIRAITPPTSTVYDALVNSVGGSISQNITSSGETVYINMVGDAGVVTNQYTV
jgi:hypothetical protein